jgi:hypothetical protein
MKPTDSELSAAESSGYQTGVAGLENYNPYNHRNDCYDRFNTGYDRGRTEYLRQEKDQDAKD